MFLVVVTLAQGHGLGTAFYIGGNEFLTAAHVVSGAKSIRLQNHERTLGDVEVIGTDGSSDVAVLRADGSGIPAMRFGDESKVGRGAPLAAVGYPGAAYGPETEAQASIVGGLLSARWRDPDYKDVFYLQTDAAANPGNSGGPIIDTCGNVLGLVVSKVQGPDVVGIAYAVTEETVQTAILRARRNVTPTVPVEQREVRVFLVQNVRGDSAGGRATYNYSRTCGGVVYDTPGSTSVELREGRFNISAAISPTATPDGVLEYDRDADGQECVVTVSISNLPAHCAVDCATKSVSLAAATGPLVIIEFLIDC